MLFINKLTEPGGIKKIVARKDSIDAYLRDGSKAHYKRSDADAELVRVANLSDFGALDAAADQRDEAHQ